MSDTTGPTLVILAAGIGSRYGGLKQLEGVGPGGEILLDYSIWDARKAGFAKVVCVIRRELEEAFEEKIGRRLRRLLPVQYAYQELDALPEGYVCPPRRGKPWGTGHAVLVARDNVQGPFCVINADDFYGSAAFRTMAEELARPVAADGPSEWVIVAYRLRKTLSEHGAVSRGVCTLDSRGFLAGIDELVRVEAIGEGARYRNADDSWGELTGDEPTSINFWGFTPEVFDRLEGRFRAFLDERADEEKAEFYLPTGISDLIDMGDAQVRVSLAEDRWLGVTHPEDRHHLVAALAVLVEQGAYPARLWT